MGFSLVWWFWVAGVARGWKKRKKVSPRGPPSRATPTLKLPPRLIFVKRNIF
jgi:hypothetical protein